MKYQPNAIHILATAYDDHSLYTLQPEHPQTAIDPGANDPLQWMVHYGSGGYS